MLRGLPITLVVIIGIVTILTAAVVPLQIQASTTTTIDRLPTSITSQPETDRAIPPGGCPEGFIPATPPLNPQLGCLPESASADPGTQPGPSIPPGGCPEGFIPATPPLNPQLGCLPDTLTSDPGTQPGPAIPPGGCPEGFIRATPPLNPQLGCLPGSETAEPGVQPGDDEREVPDDSADDETTNGDETTLSAVPVEREPAENGDGVDDGEDEDDESEGSDENGNGRGDSDGVVQ